MGFEYPVFLDLTGVHVLVVGGGRVALRKTEGLADSGAVVTVVAPEIHAGIAALASRVEQRPYRDGEVSAYQLVITATNDPAINGQVADEARMAKVWVNSADDPDNCSFILPAVARRGVITIAVSTGGASPALASRLRTTIAERELTPELEAAATELARQRAEIHAAGGSTEDVDWHERVDNALRGGINPIG